MSSLYEAGWRQGSVFEAALPCSWVDVDEGGRHELRSRTFDRWVVCTQDCDLNLAPVDSDDWFIEVRPVLDESPPQDWGIRSRKLRLDATQFVDSSSPRSLLSARAVASVGSPALNLADDRAKAFKTWLGLRYDRPAVPKHLVDLARDVATHCGRKSGRVVGEQVHEVLMQFYDTETPPRVALFAVITDVADRDAVLRWLSEAALRVDQSLGIVAHMDAARRSETPLSLIEESYAADLSQVTWATEQPRGAS